MGEGGVPAGGADPTSSSSAGGGELPPPPTDPVACSNQVYDCGDTVDNDLDGLIDYQDPDCLGPCDNTEDSYYPELPGQPGAPCALDCFWDQGNGSGNDECYWDHRCDPLAVAPDFPPEGAGCAYDAANGAGPLTCAEAAAGQSTTCGEVCGPLTPNGCDCFGCCELPAGSGKFVWTGSEDELGAGSCTIDTVGDPTKCKPCTPVPSCQNDCLPCELCVGKTTLPPQCGDPECPSDVQPCGLPGQELCPQGFYCITGCCQPTAR